MYYRILFLSLIISQLSLPSLAQKLPWFKVTPDYNILDILYDNSGNLYYSGISSSSSYFYRSSDDGNTWIQGGNGLNDKQLFRIAIDSSGTLWGVNNTEGGIFKSSNQGIDWTIMNLSTESLYSVEISYSDNWVWAGGDGQIFFSSDDGNNWNSKDISPYKIISIAINSNNNIFLGAEANGIYRSTNFGETWENVYPSGQIYSIVIDDSNYIYALRSGFRIVSYDNGNTWIFVDNVSYNMQSLYMDNNHNYWAGNSDSFGTQFSTDLIWWDYKGLSYVRPFAFKDSIIFAGTEQGLYRFDPNVYTYIGNNYFPLNIGNKWQYFYSENSGYHNIVIDSVVADTVANNMEYFKLQGLKNDWVRYSEIDKILYIRWNDSDYVQMNYNLNEGTNYFQMNFSNHNIREVEAIQPGYYSVFDNTYHYRGYFWTTGGIFFNSELSKHAENLGEVFFRTHSESIGGSSFISTRKIIRAIINEGDSVRYMSDGEKPSIEIEPILVTNEFEVDLTFEVNHSYSYYYQGILHDFTDSVLFYSYYANEDTILYNDTTLIFGEPNTIDYIVSLMLDSTLMKNDYKFYYKIYAVDKGIVPEYSSKPDTGYYELIYDPNPVSVEINNVAITEYSLKQNYPNPFNPTTMIEYAVKKEGIVELIVYDVLGNVVKKLVDERNSPGNYSIEFDATELSSGIYFYHLKVNEFLETKKMVLLK